MSIENKSPEQIQEAKTPSLDESFESVTQELDQKEAQEPSENLQESFQEAGEEVTDKALEPTRPEQGEKVVTDIGGLGDGETTVNRNR